MDYNLYAAAARAKAERIRLNAPNLRDRTEHLRDCSGTYVVGSSTLGRYKIGYGASLRDGIGRNDSYPVKINVIMWCETDEGKQLSEQLRAIFQSKSCKVPDTPGEWYALTDENLETLKKEFGFTSLTISASSDLTTFKPENFRSFDADTPMFNIRTEDDSPLILIKSTGEAAFARTRLDKDQLISRFDEQQDLLLLGWQGQHRTDIFRITRTDLNSRYTKPEQR